MIPVFQDFSCVQAGFCNAQESPTLQDPITMNQIHGADVIVLNQTPNTPPSCDALATQMPGLKLTVKTADCAPVLFFDPVAKVIGATHAGWKGAFQGILENTMLTLLQMGATIPNIHVAVGPHLTQENFQVSPDMQSLFPKTEHHFFETRETGLYFDFTGYILHRLKRAGVQHIDVHTIDTLADLTYNSYRRNKEDPARQYSFIQLTEGA